MRDTTNYKIFGQIDELVSAYDGSLEKIDGLLRSQKQVIKMCEYYSDSRYLGTYLGNKKQIGDGSIDIPFHNIVNYRVALAKTATDLDIKDIQIVADNPKYQVHSMLLNREAYEWMKESGYSLTLNQKGQTRPKYGGVLQKKTETDKKLKIDVVKWTNVITDQNDILGGPIIETHHMSPVSIMRKKATWSNCVEVLKAHRSMKDKDKPTVIEVMEVTGEFPKAILKDADQIEESEADAYEYSLQHYFVAKVDGKKYLMYHEELSGEMGDYYNYLTWEDNGYGLGRGVIEDSEEAQVWTNDAVINESLAMALAGRAGIITDSTSLGNNVLAHDHGRVYQQKKGDTTTSFNIVPAALGQYQNIIERWRMQADNVTSSFNAVTGEQPPSGTPYSQTALLNQVATKPFDYKREEGGIDETKIFEKWVIPFLIKKIKREHILVSEFSDTELEMIDESFAVYNSNKDIVDEVLEENFPSQADQMNLIEGYKKHIKKQGKKRFIKVPEDYFKDIECKVTVVTTGEQKNKAAILQSLSTLLRDVQASFNPNTGEFAVLKDPTLSKIFSEIVEIAGSGVSPISLGLGSGATPTKQTPQGSMSPVAPPVPSPAPAPMA